MLERFERQKNQALANYQASKSVGDVDEEAIPLLDYVNSLKDHYTTSSCSGRTSLLDDNEVKGDSRFIKQWHVETTAGEVMKAASKPKYILWFKYEAPILHIASRDTESANTFLAACRNSGLKRGGIQSLKPGRVMLEVFGTKKIEAPLMNKQGMLVDEDYLEILVETSNRYLMEGFKQLRRLTEGLKKSYA